MRVAAAAVLTWRLGGSRSSGSSTSAGPDRADEVQRAGDDDGPAPSRGPGRPRPRGVRRPRSRSASAGAPVAPAARRARRPACARGPSTVRGDDASRRASAAAPASAATIPSTSLSAIGRRRPASAAPGARYGRRSSSACARAAAPAGLWAPSSRTSSPSTVEQLEPARPAPRSRSPRRRASASARRDPGRLERVEERVGDRDVGRLVAAAQPDPRRARAAAARRSSPSRSQPSSGAGSTSVSGAPIRARPPADDASASPVAPVTARSPRSMIAAFSRAIAAIVGPSRSVWSRATLVIAATPPSQAWVASSRPPSPTSTSATSRSRLGEVAEDHRGQQLELGRLAVAARDPVGDGEHRLDEAREVAGVDRPAVDRDAARGT